MRFLFFALSFVSLVFAVDYSTLYHNPKGYEGSGVYVSGYYFDHACSERYVDTEYRRKEIICSVVLVLDSFDYRKLVTVEVGSTWERDFTSSNSFTKFGFDCVYRGNLNRFEGCR
jgi:hypothetical protein